MIPHTVVFDLGKVLLDFDYGIAVSRIQRSCRLSQSELQKLINQSPLLHRYETNLLSTAEFFNEIQEASGFGGTIDQFRDMFADIFTAIEPMVLLQQQLRSAGVPTYVFSNTNDLAVQHIRARFPFFSQFDGYILSYEHNVMKPDPRIYAIVERTAGRAGPELLYIDDRPENIAIAQQRGWQTVLHHDPATTAAAVKGTGLLPNGQLPCKSASSE
jgi:HAD superfamily hydrolase (TIGR01509 family)